MNWTAPIDGYCERTDAAFWSEPLNAVTNAAFLLAAIAAYLIYTRQSRTDPFVAVLIWIAAAVGIGSFLFHSLANRWSALADVIPIGLFIIVYFTCAMRRFVGLRMMGAIAATVIYVVAAIGVAWLAQPVMGSSSGYLPSLLALAGVGLLLRARRHPAGGPMIAGAVLFAVSLAMRMADLPLCQTLPFGTHFLWHCFNATLLFLLMRTAIIYGNHRT